jgi:hypothetical protein
LDVTLSCTSATFVLAVVVGFSKLQFGQVAANDQLFGSG